MKGFLSNIIPQTERKCGIYKITNLINGKVYIGQSINVYRRMKAHLWELDRNGNNMILHKAFKKYGIENFSYELICECSAEELNEKEIYFIEKYDSYNNGYNATKGGGQNLGYNPTEETRQKLRENNLGGKSHFARKTMCDGKVFDTAKECAKYLEIPYTSIKDWLSGKIKMPKKFYDRGLRYVDVAQEDYEFSIPKAKKVVYKNQVYNSIREFSKQTGIAREKLRNKTKEQLEELGIRILTDEEVAELLQEGA